MRRTWLDLATCAGTGAMAALALSIASAAAFAQSAEPAAAPPAATAPVAAKGPSGQRASSSRDASEPRATTTRYSRKQSGSGQIAAATAGSAPAAEIEDVVCTAGCNGTPGASVFSARTGSAPATDDIAAAGTPEATVISCVAGCYDGTTSLAGVASTESGMVATGARVPKGPTSGDWMVRINRERGAEQGR